jgi:hypothetical protein
VGQARLEVLVAAGTSLGVVGHSLIAVFQGSSDRELEHQEVEEMCLDRNCRIEWGRSWVEMKGQEC